MIDDREVEVARASRPAVLAIAGWAMIIIAVTASFVVPTVFAGPGDPYYEAYGPGVQDPALGQAMTVVAALWLAGVALQIAGWMQSRH